MLKLYKFVKNTYYLRTCSITIQHFSSEDQGSWRRRVNHSASTQYQEAIIEVREDMKDINVRLPENVTPTR